MIQQIIDAVRQTVHDQLAQQAKDEHLSEVDRQQLGKDLILAALDRHAEEALRLGRTPLTPGEEEHVATTVFNHLFLGAGLQPLLDDPEIETININGCDDVHVRFGDGRRVKVAPVARSDKELIALIRGIVNRQGRRFDLSSVAVSVRLEEGDGARLFAVMDVSDRPSVSIRRQRKRHMTLKEEINLGTLDEGMAELFSAVVKAGLNILVTGRPGSGKTTLLIALATEIPPEERVITIEDVLELHLKQDTVRHPNVVELLSRDPNTEGEGEVTLADLVRFSLRMSPDWVIQGESRGFEVISLLNTMSQGTSGMSTIHANSTADAITKLCTYAYQSQERLPMEATCLLIASAIDFIVHLGFDSNGTRIVQSIREVVDADGRHVSTNEIYKPGPSNGLAVPGAPMRTQTLERLIAAGLDPEWISRRWAQ